MFSDIAVRILPILSMKRELHIDGDIVSPHQYKPFGKKYDSCYNLLQVNHMSFPVLLDESITYVEIVVALHQVLYIWHFEKKMWKAKCWVHIFMETKIT